MRNEDVEAAMQASFSIVGVATLKAKQKEAIPSFVEKATWYALHWRQWED